LDDHHAIRRLKRGDISGLQTLVERYQVKAVRTAYLITHNPVLADDIMQSAFLRVYDSIQQFDLKRPFEPWFMRIVVNIALKAMKAELAVSVDEGSEELFPDFESDPAQMFEAHEMETAVRYALEQLTPPQRAVIVLYYYLGYTEGEISRELERPLGTVRWQIHAAKQKLKYLLYQFETGGSR
jgi:RNA polymerase sigma-70 factor, ECF subfamily